MVDLTHGARRIETVADSGEPCSSPLWVGAALAFAALVVLVVAERAARRTSGRQHASAQEPVAA